MNVTKSKLPNRESVDADTVRIGKDVIEILTTGMYVSPVTIYREYIQNAADSIDIARSEGLLAGKVRGEVSINFDHATRSVVIRDNGAGISSRAALSTLLAVGGSPKRGTQARGFRGVGRLSGLAYCRQLEFRTKASGDDKVVTVAWDCRALRERLADLAFNGDLRRIISEIVSVSYEEADRRSDHFFEVRLHDVGRLRNDILLNEKVISHYLAQVGPVPFAPDFSFGGAIGRRLQTHLHRIPIDLKVDGEPVFRLYGDEIIFPGSSHTLGIEDIEYVEFADVDGTTGAVGWIAHHEYVRSIPGVLGVRGLRARIGDTQVGESNLFDDSFKEPRFNGWTIGELHILDRRIVPNARRDNFEINHHYSNLLVQLGPFAKNITQRCRSSSVARNAAQTVQNLVTEVSGRLKHSRSLDRAELSRLKSSVVRARTVAKRIANENARPPLEAKLDRLEAMLQKATPKRGASVVALDEALRLVTKIVTNRDQAKVLIDAIRRLSG